MLQRNTLCKIVKESAFNQTYVKIGQMFVLYLKFGGMAQTDRQTDEQTEGQRDRKTDRHIGTVMLILDTLSTCFY